MPALATIEDALLARCRETLGTRLRGYAPLPGSSASAGDTVRRVSSQIPGVFALWGGFKPTGGDRELYGTSSWWLYAITRRAAGDAQRRRGEREEIGDYATVAALAVALHGWRPTLDDCGTVQVAGARRLFDEGIHDQGLAASAIELTVPHGFDAIDVGTLINDFITFAPDYDIDQDGTIDISDVITLPQD